MKKVNFRDIEKRVQALNEKLGREGESNITLLTCDPERNFFKIQWNDRKGKKIIKEFSSIEELEKECSKLKCGHTIKIEII